MPLKLMGLSVWVTSNGAPLEEYRTTAEDDSSIWCIIPSVAGETFQIRWDDRSENPVSLVACYMDGRSMGGMPSLRNTNGCNDGVRMSEVTVKPFRFSSVTTTDDEDVADPDGVNPDLGCIQVEFHRMSPHMQKDRRRRRRGEVHEIGPIHERSKKLGAHCVSLGDEQRTENMSQFVAPTLLDNGPYAVFRFIYRPRELLLARGVIPSMPNGIDVKPDIKPDVKPQIKDESVDGQNQSRPHNVKSRESSRSERRSRRSRSDAAKSIPHQPKLTARERRRNKQEVKNVSSEVTVKAEPTASTSRLQTTRQSTLKTETSD